MKCLSQFVLLLTLSAVFAAAQDPAPAEHMGPSPRKHFTTGGPRGFSGIPGFGDWWRNSEVAQAINLSDQQKEQLNQTFASHRETLIKLRGNVEIEEGRFQDLLDQDQPQQDKVLSEMTQLQNARNALEKEFTVMSLSLRGVLTPDQWKKLQQLTKERMGKKMFFRMHGPEGPGPAGPGPAGAGPGEPGFGPSNE
jgi:Spy/CpxP family protein refolding chaperone